MSSCAELTLGRPSDLAHSHYKDDFNVGRHRHQCQRQQSGEDRDALMAGSKLEEYVKELEEERKKIEGFKRELPLCMELLTEVMRALKEQLKNGQDPKSSSMKEKHSIVKHFDILPLLQQLAPTTNDHYSDSEHEQDQEVKFMNCKQKNEQSPARNDEMNNDKAYSCHGDDEVTHELYRAKSIKINCDRKGAFLPFNKTTNGSSPSPFENGEKLPSNAEKASSPSIGTVENPGTKDSGDEDATMTNPSSNNDIDKNSVNRKPRRCWSPELHRKFVDALQKLGGSEVATPKQIRELMKVDGLTNDEVKSHLQKYRLHTRRPNVNYDTTSRGPQLVVLDGIWLPQEYGNAAVLVNQALMQSQTNMAPETPKEYMNFGSTMANIPKASRMPNISIHREQDVGIDGHNWTSYGHHQQAGPMFRENGIVTRNGKLNTNTMAGYKRTRYSTNDDNNWDEESEAEAGRVYQITRLDL